MPVTAAIVGGLGAVGGAAIQSNAANHASQQQANSAANALALQKQEFGVAQGALSPYSGAGASILPTLQSLITPGTAQSTLDSLPGFQFALKYGQLGARNALTATGQGGVAVGPNAAGMGSGGLGVALSNYNQGLASTYYQNAVGNLQNFANMGLSGASALGGVSSNAANTLGGTTQNIGNALASGTLGSANALAGGLSGVGNSALLGSLLNNGNGSLYGNMGNLFNGSQPNIAGPSTGWSSWPTQ